MKNLLKILMVLFIVVISINGQALNDNAFYVEEKFNSKYVHIEELAELEWNDDYSMIIFEINRQCNSFVEFTEILADTKEGTKEHIIMLVAMEKWWYKERETCDWRMVMYEYNKQLKAYKEIK